MCFSKFNKNKNLFHLGTLGKQVLELKVTPNICKINKCVQMYVT